MEEKIKIAIVGYGNLGKGVEAAEGGENPIVANKLTNGVSTLYNIPVSSVIVFEKEQEE